MKWPNITGKKARVGAMLIVIFLALGLAIPIVGGFFFGGQGSTGSPIPGPGYGDFKQTTH